jgi:curved DNA-binding protein CbpA
MPVLTDWVAPAEVLGQVLLGHRLIDEGQLARALESSAATGGLLGQHLLDHGALDRPRLLEGLRQQCMRKLMHLFALQGGEAAVTVGDAAGLEADLLPLNVLGLLLMGVSVTYDEVRVAAEMGATLEETLRVTGALARYRSHFGFRAGDEAVLQGLEKGAQLAQLATLPGTSMRRAAQLVYTLWACQMLKTGAAAEVAPPPAASASVPGRPSVPMPPPIAGRPVAAPPVPTTGRPTVPTPAPVAGRPGAAPPAAAAPASPRARGDTPPDLEAATAAADDGFIAELEALEAKLAAEVHAFELFGVPLSATKRDVRGAWTELSRKFHPDALQSQGRGHLRERVNDVFAALSEAQQVLGDAEQRDKLRAAIEKGDHEPRKDGQDATARARAVFQSELLAKEGDKLLRANRFDRALERYREAAIYDADEPDLKAAIAWCEYQLSAKSPGDVVRIRTVLAEVIEQAPRIARAHHFLGFVLSDLGRRNAAIEAFRTAARLDPRLIDAERQARALELRSASSEVPPPVKRSGLKGLFGGGGSNKK